VTVLVETAQGDRVLSVLDLWRLRTATLAEVDAAAALQTRVDRKYLVPAEVAQTLVGELAGSHHVLSVKGRVSTSYASTYFDLPGFQSYRAHVQGRRRRWKVRTRLYVEDGLCRLELKTKDNRGQTVKVAHTQPAPAFGTFTESGRGFLADRLASEALDVPVGALRPGVRIDYARATLCDLDGGTRVTVDGGLVASLRGRVVRISPHHVLVETKGGLRPAPADLLLLRHGVRPTSVSKYGVTLSMLEPGLPASPWRRLARRHFCVDPV
jgi:VTC domain